MVSVKVEADDGRCAANLPANWRKGWCAWYALTPNFDSPAARRREVAL